MSIPVRVFLAVFVWLVLVCCVFAYIPTPISYIIGISAIVATVAAIIVAIQQEVDHSSGGY